MKKRRLVAQEEGIGCGLACVASELGVTYQRARRLSGRPESSYTDGYSCQDLVRILNDNGRNYAFRDVKDGDDQILQRDGTIVYVKDGEDDLLGHYLLKTENGWMDSWANWPNIKPAKAGYCKELPGIPKWVIHENN